MADLIYPRGKEDVCMHESRRTHRPLVEPLESRTLLAATRIMPLGDSITEASAGRASYRYWLWHQLIGAGYDVDFVGSMTGVSGGQPQFPDFDQNHEGHSGWRADQIQANIINWAHAHQPEVVLLHIGTNDITTGQSNASTISEIGGTIDNLRSVRPGIVVLLAQIIPNTVNNTAVQQLNTQIATLAGQKSTAQSPVVLVDQFTGFSTSQDMYDALHPDESGEQKIANKFYAALSGVLPPPVPPTGTVYVSNINFTTVSNGWGPVERDRSNGEAGSGDGRVLTLNGQTFTKGLGVHSASDVRVNLIGGNYTEFRASVGLDDEIGNNGSVVFQVYVDNVLRYDSGLMNGATATKQVAVPVASSAQTLRLVVTNGGDNIFYDHADWADARLLRGEPVPAPAAPTDLSATLSGQQINLAWTDASNDESGFRVERKTGSSGTWAQIAELGAGAQSHSDTNISPSTTYFYRVYAFNTGGPSSYSNESNASVPAPPPPPPGTVAYVSDLSFTTVSNGWGPVERDRANGDLGLNDGPAITLNGQVYTKGLGVHAASEVRVNLVGGNYTEFRADVGVDDIVGSSGSVVFQVYVDNVLRYDSGVMNGNTATKQVVVPIAANAATLRLVVTNGGDNNYFDHSDWANARLIIGEPVPPPAPAKDLVANLNLNKVDLGWVDGSTDESGFVVERKQGASGSWTAVQTLGAGAQSWSDTSALVPGSTYVYRVVAYNGGGNASPSNESSINTPAPTGDVWVSDLPYTLVSNGWGPAERDRSNGESGANDGRTIAIRGNTYTKGFGVHAGSEIRVNLGGQYSTFTSDIGVDNETGGNGSVIFRVYVDGVLRFDSGMVRGTDAVRQAVVSVAGGQELRLVVTDGGDNFFYDHADWAGAKLAF
jgi:hypothetical protein